MPVGDRDCFTVVSDTDPSIFSSYCAVLEDIAFAPSQGTATVIVEIQDRDDADGGVVVDPNVQIVIGSNTVHDKVHTWPPPGGDHVFIQESGGAQAGDLVQVIVSHSGSGEQFTITGTVGDGGGVGGALGERGIQALMVGSGLVGLGVVLR